MPSTTQCLLPSNCANLTTQNVLKETSHFSMKWSYSPTPFSRFLYLKIASEIAIFIVVYTGGLCCCLWRGDSRVKDFSSQILRLRNVNHIKIYSLKFLFSSSLVYGTLNKDVFLFKQQFRHYLLDANLFKSRSIWPVHELSRLLCELSSCHLFQNPVSVLL